MRHPRVLQHPGTVLWAFEACVFGRLQNPFRGVPASKPLRAHGYKGLSATRLRPPGKVLWALETCVWPASKPFSRGPASKPSHAHGHKGVKGHPARFYGPSKLAFGRLQNPFRGVPASKPLRAHGYMTLRPPGKVLWAFEACVWPASKPFSRGPGVKTCSCTWLHDPQATRQGFMGLRSLRLAGFKTLFAGSRPQKLRMHMANSSSQPASNDTPGTTFHGPPTSRSLSPHAFVSSTVIFNGFRKRR